MLNARDLTNGETLLLQRRRGDLTAAAAAKRHKVTLYRYNRWERDLERGPRVTLGAIAFYEKAHLLRRRAGLSVVEFAKRLGVSAWWLSQMEDGKAPDMRLRKHWTTPSAGSRAGSRSLARQARSPRAPARKRRRTS